MKALVILLMSVVATPGFADTPDPLPSTATANAGCLLVVPDGSGPSLVERDVVITVQVIDQALAPIAGFPFQDIVAGDNAGFSEVSVCNNGSVADGNTNANGITTISGPLSAGGWTQSGMQVYLAGVAITSSPALSIDVNSPDITGDLIVNIADVGNFAIDFLNGIYDFRSDLDCNQIENLADVGTLAEHLGAICP